MPTTTNDPDSSRGAQPADPHTANGTAGTAGTVASDDLVALVCASNGLVPRGEALAHGFTAQQIAEWLQNGVLTEVGGDQLRLTSPDVYIDPLIQALWLVPDGVIGGLTALEYYGLSTVWAPDIQIAVSAPRPLEPLPRSLSSSAIRPLVLPSDLFLYGIERVVPSLPGSVTIAMYSPAVALAQILADQDCDEDTLNDAVVRYLGVRGLSSEERAAAERYGVAARLERLTRPYARTEQ